MQPLKSWHCHGCPFAPDKIKDYNDLAKAYSNAIKTTTAQIETVLTKTYGPDWRLLLGNLYGNVDPTKRWETTLNNIVAAISRNTNGMQYVYDLLQDIAATYVEFKEALWAENVICCPDFKAFPKHVVLGPATAQPADDSGRLRHEFYESPILNLKSENLEKARFLHKRIDVLLSSFSIPTASQTLRITPSQRAATPLGAGAIPYYYKISRTQPVHAHWSHAHAVRNSNDAILSYSAKLYSSLPQTLEPLSFSLKPFDFFRIEGHLGMSIETAEKQLSKLVKEYNLPINLLSLQIESGIRPLRPRPYYGSLDLKAMHYLNRRDMTRHLGTIKSFTQTMKRTILSADVLPGKEQEEDSLSFKKYIEDGAKELDTAIDDVGRHLQRTYKEFDYESFLASYNAVLQKTANINKNIKGITSHSSFSPYETLVNGTRFRQIKRINDILKARADKASELSVFSRFLAASPALSHMAGVERGGTFVLVYSSTSKKVVADFALPYWHYAISSEVEDEEKVVAVEEKDDWIKLNDLAIKLSKENILQKNYDTLKNKMSNLEGKVIAQDNSLNVYAASLKTYTDTVLKTKVADMDVTYVNVLYDDENLAARAAILNSAGEYIKLIDAQGDKATADEKKVKARMEGTSRDIIKEAMNKFAKKKTDVEPNSQDERFIETAVSTVAKISNAAVRKAISTDMTKVRDLAKEKNKSILSARLNDFISK